ncbi:hypothetical protein Tco_1052519, partial [Tanacetum coccineum]
VGVEQDQLTDLTTYVEGVVLGVTPVECVCSWCSADSVGYWLDSMVTSRCVLVALYRLDMVIDE